MVARGYKETEIGVIPVEWDVVKLQDYIKLTSGKFNPKKNLQDKQNDTFKYPVYGGNGLTGFFTDSLVSKPTIIIGRVGEYCGSVHLEKNSIWITDNAIYTKEISPQFNIDFLYETFGFIGLENLAERTGQPKITQEPIYNLQIPLPPLKEQEKIADILSTADDKIDAIASQIQKAQTLKKGLLQKLLSEGLGHSEFKDSELGKIPKSWEVVKLNDLGKIITGSTPKTSNQDFYLNGTRLWASPSDLGKSKEIKTTNTKLSDLGFEQIRVLEKRSILITCIGSTIGKMGIAYEEMSSNQQINAITCNEYNNPDFYYYVLLKIQDKIKKLAGTQAVPLLNKTDFSHIKVIKAPLEEQKQIAEILSTADEKLEVLRAKKEKYETLKKGLLQKLLSGEVRTV